AVVGTAAARPHAGPLQSVALYRLGMANRGAVEALGALLGAAVEAVVVFAAALVRAAGDDVHAPQGAGAVAFEGRGALTPRGAVETAGTSTGGHSRAAFRAECVAHPFPRLGRPLRLGQDGQRQQQQGGQQHSADGRAAVRGDRRVHRCKTSSGVQGAESMQVARLVQSPLWKDTRLRALRTLRRATVVSFDRMSAREAYCNQRGAV